MRSERTLEREPFELIGWMHVFGSTALHVTVPPAG